MTQAETAEITKPPAGALLTGIQAAKWLGVSEYTLRRWRSQGRGPACVRVGRLVRYRTEDLARWADAHAQVIERGTEGTAR